MVGRFLRVGGTVLAVALGLVTPVLATATASPAAADTVVDGCTVVSNPTTSHFTDCSGKDLSAANFDNLNLNYANFSDADFVDCNSSNFVITCTAAAFAGTTLTQANLTGATLTNALTESPGAREGDAEVDFTNDNLARVDLASTDAGPAKFSNATLAGSNLTNANLSGANLTNANLSGAALSGASMSGDTGNFPIPLTATLTDANFTGTLLVPPNQTSTATSQSGATVTWPTPAALSGATPGSCTPASGSGFPLFSSTVTCQVLDANNDVATGTFSVNVAPTTQYFTRVLIPSNGASLSGSTTLDAEAADDPGVTSVDFELSGGSLTDQVVATGASTIYGWLAQWNSTTVPNGTYTLVSAAIDKDNDTDTSTPVSITVNNPLPTTNVLIPSQGATLSGSTYLDASASKGTAVKFFLFGGSYGFAAPVICTATPTIYGWLCAWNTTTVPNNSYVLVAEASNSSGNTFSSGVSMNVRN
jgi:uncharacterized protein YjbI with pentapeptide repeats